MGWIVGWKFRLGAAKFFRMMVARDGVAAETAMGPLLNLIANHECERYKFGWLRGPATIRIV